MLNLRKAENQLSFVKSFQRVAVLISGTGSCLQSLLELAEYQDVRVVITNKKNIFGALKARRFGVEVIFIESKNFFAEIDLVLTDRRIEKIFLAGFMKIVPSDFLNKWDGRIFNIHPSLLPDFKGLHAFEASYRAKANMGATIHHVIPLMDAGPIVLQKKSLDYKETVTQQESEIYLRATEQHIVRELGYKGLNLCQKF